jgi:hypothetical protein
MFCPKCGTENPETGRFCRSCGTDLSGVSQALSTTSQSVRLANQMDAVSDRASKPLKKKKKSDDADWLSDPFCSGGMDVNGQPLSDDPDVLVSGGVRDSVIGVGFLIVSLVLLFTNVANGQRWWWALLFPAFISLANGLSKIFKARNIEKRLASANANSASLAAVAPPVVNSLPQAMTEFVKPQNSIYETGDLVVPPSVVEDTTRQLAINNEGETMTLPKRGA